MSIRTEIDRIIGHVSDAHERVKAKGGTTAAPYLIAKLADAIDTIPEAVDPKLQSKTVAPSTSSQTVKPDSGYDGLSQVTVNAMPTAAQATPSISVSSAGLITASATQSAGYVSAGTKSATKQLTTQGAQTITPDTSDKTIASGRYLTGTQTIKGDANLVAGNIKSGVSIFGVSGTFEGAGSGSGALPAGVTAMDSGIFTPSSDISSTYYVNHKLGVKPNFFSIVAMGDYSTEARSGTLLSQTTIGKPFTEGSVQREATLTTIYALDASRITGITNTYSGMSSTTRCFIEAGSSYVLKAGVSYRWIACVLEWT